MSNTVMLQIAKQQNKSKKLVKHETHSELCVSTDGLAVHQPGDWDVWLVQFTLECHSLILHAADVFQWLLKLQRKFWNIKKKNINLLQ